MLTISAQALTIPKRTSVYYRNEVNNSGYKFAGQFVFQWMSFSGDLWESIFKSSKRFKIGCFEIVWCERVRPGHRKCNHVFSKWWVFFSRQNNQIDSIVELSRESIGKDIKIRKHTEIQRICPKTATKNDGKMRHRLRSKNEVIFSKICMTILKPIR